MHRLVFAPGRFAANFAEWFADHASRRTDMDTGVIDLVDVDLPMVLPLVPGAEAQAYIDRINRADAFVVITLEYNHGDPAH